MSTVDEVKQRLDIVEVISASVQLQKAGRNFKARCPFHSERTPSFYVFPDRQSWHCFGACGTGGDVIAFVMKKENLDFPEALRVLAERAGVTLERGSDPQQESRRERLRQANEAAALFYAHALLHSEAGAPARRYLAQRGVGDDALRLFQLGYAPGGWDLLRQHLHSRGFQDDELLEAGLILRGERGLHDRFRHRLIFPIRDERGRVVGFGGRALSVAGDGPGEVGPKYLNTPQTPLFDKGGLLYALDVAKDEIRRQGQAVVVEGYMDAIAAHEHGFRNVVAAMGTALTDRQVRLLKRYTQNLVLALDADSAGSEATLRGVQVITEAVDRTVVPVPTWRGLIQHQETLSADIKVISLPPERDPDEVIRTNPETWQQLVRQAKPVIDYLFETITSRLDLSQPRGRSQAVEALLPVIAAISDRVIQAHYLQRLARLAQVSEKALQDRLPRPSRRAADQGIGRPATVVRDPREEFLLALLLHYPELRERGLAIPSHLLTFSENRQLLEAWKLNPDVDQLIAGLDEPLRQHCQWLLDKKLPPFPPEKAGAALEDCLLGLARRTIEKQKYAHQQIIAEQEQILGATRIAEAARLVWESGEPAENQAGDDAIGAAMLFVLDMEKGLQLHRQRPALQPERAVGEPLEGRD